MNESKPLSKAGTVAYLLAHADALALAGVFGRDPAALAVFNSWCKHPERQLTWKQYPTAESTPVDPDFADDARKISATTLVPLSTVYNKLIRLREMGLIAGGPGTGERPMILSVNRASEIARINELKPFPLREPYSSSETVFPPLEYRSRPLTRRRS
jgi:hypothetical protein